MAMAGGGASINLIKFEIKFRTLTKHVFYSISLTEESPGNLPIFRPGVCPEDALKSPLTSSDRPVRCDVRKMHKGVALQSSDLPARGMSGGCIEESPDIFRSSGPV